MRADVGGSLTFRGASITINPHVLSRDATVTITLRRNIDDRAQAFSFDVGNASINGEVEIAVPWRADPPPLVPLVTYLDEQARTWRAIPATYQRDQQRVVASVTHLSTWSGFDFFGDLAERILGNLLTAIGATRAAAPCPGLNDVVVSPSPERDGPVEICPFLSHDGHPTVRIAALHAYPIVIDTDMPVEERGENDGLALERFLPTWKGVRIPSGAYADFRVTGTHTVGVRRDWAVAAVGSVLDLASGPVAAAGVAEDLFNCVTKRGAAHDDVAVAVRRVMDCIVGSDELAEGLGIRLAHTALGKAVLEVLRRATFVLDALPVVQSLLSRLGSAPTRFVVSVHTAPPDVAVVPQPPTGSPLLQDAPRHTCPWAVRHCTHAASPANAP
jgi:hypothetical protein